jgi:phosphatidylglycerophosphate synthase
MITIDNDIGKIVAKMHIFKYMHPNAITLIGMICNIILYYGSLFKLNTHMIAILLLLRWFTDVMDGNVAREYNKTSKFGGFLDTITDTSFSMVMVYLITLKWSNNIIYAIMSGISLGICMISYMMYHNSLCDHTNIKVRDTIWDYCMALCVENTIIVYIALVIANYIYGII